MHGAWPYQRQARALIFQNLEKMTMATLRDDLIAEIVRVRTEVLPLFDPIPGSYAKVKMRQVIDAAEQAMAANDTEKMTGFLPIIKGYVAHRPAVNT